MSIRDSSDEEGEMAPKTGPSLKEIMKNRKKVPSPQDKNKSKRPINLLLLLLLLLSFLLILG